MGTPRDDARQAAEAKAGRLFAIVLAIATAIGLFVISPFIVVRTSGVWQSAVNRALADQRVLKTLGEPVEAGWSFSYDQRATETHIEIPLEGAAHDGTLIATGVETGGVWGFKELKVVSSSGTVIKLVE